jgi:3-keto-5-aminohexanoate cleavage enzyme
MAKNSDFKPLPLIMVAPNGARRTKDDHAALPMTISETVEAARASFEAGARGMHAHVRNSSGEHVLDAGLYRELLTEMKAAVPDMLVQITSEGIGKYGPDEQRKLVQELLPDAVSIAVREMIPDNKTAEAATFYAWALKEQIAIQHIVYSAEDLTRFFDLVESGTIPGKDHQLLFVLGRYANNQESAPEDLDPFLETLTARRSTFGIDWAVCAFGHQETDCLAYAIERGGKARVGLENGLWNRDGTPARDNADRVKDLVAALKEKNLAEFSQDPA